MRYVPDEEVLKAVRRAERREALLESTGRKAAARESEVDNAKMREELDQRKSSKGKADILWALTGVVVLIALYEFMR